MKKNSLFLSIFCFALFFAKAQTASDSIQLIHDRNVLIKSWDDAKTILADDSSKANMIVVLKSTTDLINMDDNISSEYTSEYLKSKASQKIIQELTKQISEQSDDLNKARDQQLQLILGGGVLALLLLVFIILFIIFLVKSGKLKKSLSLSKTEDNNFIAEKEKLKKELDELKTITSKEQEELKQINITFQNKNKELEIATTKEKNDFENTIRLLSDKENKLLAELEKTKLLADHNPKAIQLTSEKNQLENELERYKSLYTQEIEQSRKISGNLQQLEKIQDQLIEKYEQELVNKETQKRDINNNYKDQYEQLLKEFEHIQVRNAEIAGFAEQEKQVRIQIEDDLRQLLKDLGGK